MLFDYRGRNREGRRVRGRVEAADRGEALTRLRAEGIFVTHLEQNRDVVTVLRRLREGWRDRGRGDGEPRAPRRRRLSTPLLPRRLPSRDVATFARELGTMLQAGLPLLTALRVIAQQAGRRSRVGSLATTLADDVEAGHPLAEALARQRGLLPPIAVHMVAAGEHGGMLDRTLLRLAEHLEREVQVDQKVRAATAYPKVVVAVTGLVLAFMVQFDLPRFTDLFEQLGADLPALTRGLLAVSRAVQRYWYAVPLVASVLGATWAVLVRVPAVRLQRDRQALRLPVFGPLRQKRATARLARTLAALLRAGVPILDALRLVQPSLDNRVLEGEVERLMAAVAAGRPLSEPLRAGGVFPPLLAEMVGVGEETGTLDEVLDRVAETYEAEVARTGDQLASLLEPMLVVVLGGVVALVLLAVILPAVTLWQILPTMR